MLLNFTHSPCLLSFASSIHSALAAAAFWVHHRHARNGVKSRKLATRAPALLSLSVENNLEPTLGFLVKELGMDPANLSQVVLALVDVMVVVVAAMVVSVGAVVTVGVVGAVVTEVVVVVVRGTVVNRT